MRLISRFNAIALTRSQLAQLLLFSCFLINQVQLVSKTDVEPYPLPQPISASDLRVLTLGESAIMAKLLGVWLLSYDTRAGQIIPFERLDYDRLAGWLKTIAQLDELSDYSSMVAAGVFIDVKDRQRQLKMIELVRQRFWEKPEINWRWMAQAIMLSKYRLKDISLALSLAQDLRIGAQGKGIPYWASEMEVYLLHDMGELEAALLLIKAMIDDGAITDADELRFLNRRIMELEASMQSNQNNSSNIQHN
ncbi:MAG: hypothetical protein JXA04_05635 [Gammaproteobacteria bacterium]|nr:hypothetical protein [Gammaproteobacteria bacterium]